MFAIKPESDYDQEDRRFKEFLESQETQHQRALQRMRKSSNNALRKMYLDHLPSDLIARGGIPQHRIALIAWTTQRRRYEMITAGVKAPEDLFALLAYKYAKYGPLGVPSMEILAERVPSSNTTDNDILRHFELWAEQRKVDVVGADNGLMKKKVTWYEDKDSFYPWRAEADGHRLQVRINDFPDQPLFTLLVDGSEIGDFEDWPNTWKRPKRTSKLTETDGSPPTVGAVEGDE